MAQRYDPDEARRALEEWLVRDEGDETRAFCPLCEDVGASNSPSASLNFAANKWNCLKTDEDGGSISGLLKKLDGDNVTPIRRTPNERQAEPEFGLSEDDVEAWHEALLADDNLVTEIEELRGWTRATLINFMIGYRRGRYMIPIYDEAGQLVNVRQYKPNPGDQQKFINIKGHGKNRLWGHDTLEANSQVLLCAGEPDRILAVQEGFPAVTWTGGEGNFQAEWAVHFEGKSVVVCLDADDAGRAGTEKIIPMLSPYAASIAIAKIPEKVKGYDVTDVIMNDGVDALQKIIDDAEEVEVQVNPITETDHGNALRLIDEHSDLFRHIADMKRWHFWNGMQWMIDINDREIRTAHINLAHRLPEGSFKRNALSTAGISSAIKIAEIDRRISILTRQLDAHPELLNMPNGVANLRTGEIGPFDPDLLLSRSTAYPADLTAPHPLWDRFLTETFGQGSALISYIQQLAGLALVGKVPEHVLPFLYGTGRNGKGVLTLVLQGLLGNVDNEGYALSAPDGFLMSGRDNSHPTELARLRGARLVVTSEQSSGKKFDEQRVKRLTGADPVTARFMHGNFFDFMPSHLLWIMSNHLPAVREGGPAFWSRVKLIPFKHVVPDEQQIKEYEKVLLAAEGPAILGWAIRGAVEVLNKGLKHPQEVLDATEAYKVSEDTLASFMRDECQQGPQLKVKVADYTARYRSHCEEMDAEMISSRALTMRLQSEYGVTSARNGSARFYKGVALSDKMSISDNS